MSEVRLKTSDGQQEELFRRWEGYKRSEGGEALAQGDAIEHRISHLSGSAMATRLQAHMYGYDTTSSAKDLAALMAKDEFPPAPMKVMKTWGRKVALVNAGVPLGEEDKASKDPDEEGSPLLSEDSEPD